MTDPRILIAVPCLNRQQVVAQCVRTLISSKAPHDVLRCYNDGSTEYDAKWLMSLGADWAFDHAGMGIDAQRRMHIVDFWERREYFTHLLFADSDSFWDENWRSAMLEIQARTHALVCGYNTATHESYTNNTFSVEDGVVWRRFAPGVSYLLSRDHVETIVKYLPQQWSFDWAIPGMLGYKCAVSRTSYTDHIGFRGLHDSHDREMVSRERALNPTEFLVAKRAEILSNLGLREAE